MEYSVIIIISPFIYLLVYIISKKNKRNFENLENYLKSQVYNTIGITNLYITNIPFLQNLVSNLDKELTAYIDIETTSLNPYNGEITLVGICLDDGNESNVIQLVGDDILASNLISIIGNVKTLCTYNGTKFDLSFKKKLGIDLTKCCVHKDLMHTCWQRGLYGG